MVHMPCYLLVLLCVPRPLHSKRGAEETVTWGTFPRGCEGTVEQRCFLYKGVRVYICIAEGYKGSLLAGTRADSAHSVSLGCVADKAYPDGCTYHYWESEGLFYQTPRTDQHVLPLWTVAGPCFRSPLGPFMDWRS